MSGCPPWRPQVAATKASGNGVGYWGSTPHEVACLARLDRTPTAALFAAEAAPTEAVQAQKLQVALEAIDNHINQFFRLEFRQEVVATDLLYHGLVKAAG